MTQIDLKDKCVLLTGASKGIGKGVATYLMRTGAQVAIHYNSDKEAAEALVSEFNNGSAAFQADLSKEAAVFSLFEAVERHFKKIDVVILNAGVFLKHPIS